MADEKGAINLNDPHCHEFIEAVATCLVHAAQGGDQAEEMAEEDPPTDNKQTQS